MKSKTKTLAYCGLFTAIVTVMTIFLKIPLPKTSGYINLGDTAIFVCAYTLGGIPAMLAGGLGSAIADLALGYTLFAPFSLAIKGAEGLIAGLLIKLFKKHLKGKVLLLVTYLSFILAGLEMVTGYFFTSWILFNLEIATLEVPMNLVQMAVSICLSSIAVLPIAISNKRSLSAKK